MDGGAGGAGARATGGARLTDEVRHTGVPMLRDDYAEWKPRMEAILMRFGLEETFTDALPDWAALRAQVRAWDVEKKKNAIAAALGRAPTKAAAKSSSSKAAADGDDESPAAGLADETMKREVRGIVERSIRAYGALYEALPPELRAQTAHIPAGYAYGVWTWLEKKYQSTEVDCVNDLIETWMELRMDENDSFDSYRARVNRLCVLLEHAKEKPSARIYMYKMLDQLQPQYKPAVLALKAGEKLKDPKNVDWEDVTAFITAHERSEHRLTMQDIEQDATSFAMSAQARPPAWTKTARCFNCGETGHIGKWCKKPRNDRARRDNEDRGRGRRADRHDDDGDDDGDDRPRRNERNEGSSKETAAMARWVSLSDSDGDDYRRRPRMQRAFSVMRTYTNDNDSA